MGNVAVTWAGRKSPRVPLITEQEVIEFKKWVNGGKKGIPAISASSLAVLQPVSKPRLGPQWRLRQRFTAINARPWAAGPLPPNILLTRQLVWQAALNSGYGIFHQSNENVHQCERASWTIDGFAAAWKRRATDLVEHLDYATNMPAAFWARLEKSDKVMPSFALGAALCRVTAECWIAVGTRSIAHFWHYGIYGQGLVSPSGNWFKPPFPVPTQSGTGPDYLVIDNHADIHLFEAKGGGRAEAWKRLEKGLGQLEATRTVKLISVMIPQTPCSAVAVYACLDDRHPISLLAYDPPTEPPHRPEEPQNLGGELLLDDSVAYGLCAMDTANIFDALERLPISSVAEPALPDFAFTSLALPDLHWRWTPEGFVGLVSDDDTRQAWRDALEAYLKVRSALPEGAVGALEPGIWKRQVLDLPGLNRESLGESYESFAGALERSSAPNQFLVELSKNLGLPQFRLNARALVNRIQIELGLRIPNRRFEVQESGLVFEQWMSPKY